MWFSFAVKIIKLSFFYDSKLHLTGGVINPVLAFLCFRVHTKDSFKNLSNKTYLAFYIFRSNLFNPMKIPLIILTFCFFAFSVQSQDNFDTVKIRPVYVSDNLYFLKGSGGNIGVFIGKEGTLMIDDQFAELSN